MSLVDQTSFSGRFKNTFLSNAFSVRDFRVQMRGNKSFFFFTAYTFILCIFGYAIYAGVVARGGSLASEQDSLRGFYANTINLLGVMLILIAPGLSATTIITERLKLSLDLVLTTPISPRTLLIGKLISAYRFVWMLLILSLPVTSVSALLGGATWKEVLVTYILLSLQGLVFTSVALYISTLARTVTFSIILSLVAIGVYVGVCSSIGGAATVGRGFTPSMGAGAFPATLSPFILTSAIGLTFSAFGHDIPVWIVGCLVSYLIIRFLLLAAHSSLAPVDYKLVRTIRLNALVYSLVLTALACYEVNLMTGGSSGLVSVIPSTRTYFGNAFFVAMAWLLPLTFGLFCFGPEGSRRFWPDGFFNIKNTFKGTPSGSLPYVLLLILSNAALGFAMVSGHFSSNSDELTALMYVVYTIAFYTFLWASAQLISSLLKNLSGSRLMLFMYELGIFILPFILFQTMGTHYEDPVTNLSLFKPLATDKFDAVDLLVYSGVVFAVSAVMVAKASSQLKKQLLITV